MVTESTTAKSVPCNELAKPPREQNGKLDTMPNGTLPKSQDDKDWKLAVDKELAELRRELATALAQIKAK